MSEPVDTSDFDYVNIEPSGIGATYNNGKPTVYGYGIYGENSVLEGQVKRVYLDTFDTIEEAQEAYPKANVAFGSSFVPHNDSDVRPAWCTPQYEAETGERWDSD